VSNATSDTSGQRSPAAAGSSEAAGQPGASGSSSDTHPIRTAEVEAVQRSTLRGLATTQVFIGGAVTASVAVSTLIAEDLLHGARWAGLAGASFTAGSALGSQLLARLSDRTGRRNSLVLGTCIAAVGSTVAVLGADRSVALVFFVGLALSGFANSAGLQARYAAADLAQPDHRARSVGLVVWALTVGAVAGPHLVGPTKPLARWMDLPVRTGPIVASAALALVAALIAFVMLRPDPLRFARSAGLAMTVAGGPKRSIRDALGAIRSSPHAQLAVFGLAISQATMVAVMSMTPVHLRAGHASDELIGGVISLHVLGMYFGAPLWGWVADRVGRIATLAIGASVLSVSAVMAATADAHAHTQLFVALFLLGVGWSLGLVASSTLLTESVDSAARVSVQGFADSTSALCGGLAAFASGQVVGSFGFPNLAWVSLVLALASLLACLRFLLRPAQATGAA
jgi:MFS family permease